MKLGKVFAVTALSALLLVGCGGAGNNQAANETANAGAEAPKVEMKDLPGTSRDGSEVEIEMASMNLVKAVEEGKYQMISTEELKNKVDAKEDMVLVDTMPAKSYNKNHIPGAVNAELPVTMEEVTPEQREAFVKALGTDKNKEIILYCGFVACERSHVGALIAKEEGFTNVVRHPGGIGAWMEAQYPVEAAK